MAEIPRIDSFRKFATGFYTKSYIKLKKVRKGSKSVRRLSRFGSSVFQGSVVVANIYSDIRLWCRVDAPIVVASVPEKAPIECFTLFCIKLPNKMLSRAPL